MDNSKLNLPEPESESQPSESESKQAESESKPLESESQPEPESENVPEPTPEAESNSYVNERIRKAYDRMKLAYTDAQKYYDRSPRLQKVAYQGKFMPAFWTVACIFSLLVNIILISMLISFGRHFFELKSLISDGLVTEASNSLSMMDQAHIVKSIPFETKVQLQDEIPVTFDLQIDQNTKLTLAQETRITGAYIYLNNTAVATDLTLPANTTLQANFDTTIPVNTTAPVDITVPITATVPIDIAIDQTDLHQSILGLQGAIEPYKNVLGSSFDSPKDFSICTDWWSGWMCNIFFGK